MLPQERGKSILQSVSDAKEITVNFNRSGSGALGASFFKAYYLFYGARGTGSQFWLGFPKIAKKNPKKIGGVIAGYALYQGLSHRSFLNSLEEMMD